MKKISLPYDKTTLDVTLPAPSNVVTITPKNFEPLPDPKSNMLSCLEAPSGCTNLEMLANGVTGKVLIVVPDHTRVSGREKALTWIIDALESYGIAADRITVLVALGSHKPLAPDALAESIGPVFNKVEVVQHDTSGPFTDYGQTSRGTPVRVNARFTEAELVILYTAVVHHYFAGFGGGRKIIVPGIASLDTISANHSLVFEGSGPSDGRNPNVKSGRLDGNPVHEDMLEAASLVLEGKKYLAIANVMTPDKNFGFSAAGTIDQAHRLACDFARKQNSVIIPELADVVIGSAGGYPKDSNLVQSHKGMDNACHALKPGGTLIYAMSCSNGFGNPAIERFAPWDLAKIRAELARDYAVYGQTVYAMKEKAQKYRIIVITMLEPDFVRTLGFEPAVDSIEALEMASVAVENAGLIYIMPRVDLAIPVLEA